MAYEEMYNNALDQEKRVIGLVSLFVGIIGCLMFFTAIIIKDDYFGVANETIRIILFSGAGVLILITVLIEIFGKPKKDIYDY